VASVRETRSGASDKEVPDAANSEDCILVTEDRDLGELVVRQRLGVRGIITWVDQHNTLGLGNDVPISTGNENDALLALVDGKWVVLRVPYPLSFYAKGLDGRIDNANAGWKGRGVWTTSGDRVPWLKQGGKGTVPIAFHFQFRPDPLAD